MIEKIHKDFIYQLHLSISILSVSSLNTTESGIRNYIRIFEESKKAIIDLISEYYDNMKNKTENIPFDVLKEINDVCFQLLKHEESIKKLI